MAAGKQQEKDPINIVHQNAILVETITKEQRHQKLNTDYGINPYMKSKLYEAELFAILNGFFFLPFVNVLQT